MSELDKYRKLHNLSGARQAPRSAGNMQSYDLKGIVAERLADLKKDFTWTPLPEIDLNTKKKPVNKEEAVAMAMDLLQTTTPLGAAAGIVKAAKGAHWYPSEPDTINDAMQGIGSRRFNNVDEHLDLLRQTDLGLTPERETLIREYDFPINQAVNNFADNQLSKYIRQRLGTENDEIRKLAEKQPIHLNLSSDEIEYGKSQINDIGNKRNDVGLPVEGVGKSIRAKNWENKSDDILRMNYAKDYLPYDGRELLNTYEQIKNPTFTNDRVTNGVLGTIKSGKLSQEDALEHYKQKIIGASPPHEGLIPRLALANPNTPIYDIGDEAPYHLGFDHLADEMNVMLDTRHLPEDWPKDLMLTPEQVGTMSVEDMVKKVAKVNQHRDKMARAAERKSDERLTELPELARSENGYRIIEHGDTTNASAQDLVRMCGEKNGWCTQGEGLSRTYGSGNNRLVNILNPENKPIYQATVTTKEPPKRMSDQDEFGVMHFESQPAQKTITEFKGYKNSTDTPPEEQRRLFIDWMKENNIQPDLGVAEQLRMSKDPLSDLYVDNQELINDIYRDEDFLDMMISKNKNLPDMDDFDIISAYHRYWNQKMRDDIGGGI